MKKLIFSLVAVAAFAALADDNYQALYWQVTADSLKSETEGYDYTDSAVGANLYATLNGETVSVPSSVSGSGLVALNREAGGALSDSANTWAIDLSGWNGGAALDGAMFYVELFSDSGSLATSAGISYANLLSHIDRNFSGSGIPQVASGPAVFSAYAVPEPTSGLLMLLGIAGLALRRKRA